jgi:hypothetical protein
VGAVENGGTLNVFYIGLWGRGRRMVEGRETTVVELQ